MWYESFILPNFSWFLLTFAIHVFNVLKTIVLRTVIGKEGAGGLALKIYLLSYLLY
jgi:hypothetical protein